MNDFLAFRKMITPLFIQFIFWIAVIATVISALIAMFSGSFLYGLIMLILGPFIARIYCELLIILFRIYDELVAIRTGTPPAGQGFPVMPPAAPMPGYVPPAPMPPPAAH